MTRPTLAELVVAARSGDDGAWGEIVRRTQDLAVAVAVNHGARWDDAADAAQEAYLTAYRRLPELREPAAFPGWLASAVRTACARRSRRRRHPTTGLGALDIPDGDATDPAAAVDEGEDRTQVRAAIEALAPPLRSVITLHYLAGMTYPEVAEFLDVGLSAVKKRAWTARRQLKELLPMVTQVLRDARPSRTGGFSDTVLLFVAIRRRDRATVAALLGQDPALVHATENWSLSDALDAGLFTAGRATPLIRAAQAGDPAIVDLLLAAGAPVNVRCSCRGAETPLWSATVAGATEVVTRLLAAGADPRVAAFAGATPLHVAAQRGATDIAELLLAAGADPTIVDDHGRTAADWTELRSGRRPTGAGEPDFVVTGVRALDLFAPLRRGGRQYWPPAYGAGQFVALFELARVFAPARTWFVGFAHGPYDAAGIRREITETGVDVTIAVTPEGPDPADRRAHFAGVLREMRETAGDKFVVCLEAPGHLHDVTAGLPELSDDPAVVTTVVVAPYSGQDTPTAGHAVPEGYDGQVAFDPTLAGRRLYPAIDPTTTQSVLALPARHGRLAGAARSLLADYRSVDPTLAMPDPASLAEPKRAGAAQKLLRYLAQPFVVAESITSRPGESTRLGELLDCVEAIIAGGG